MITKQEILSEISRLEEECKAPFVSKKSIKARKAKIAFRRKCIAYLETNPRKEFVAQQKADIDRKLSVIDARFLEWKDNSGLGSKTDNPRAEWGRMNEEEKLKAQQTALTYLLKL